MRRILPGLLFLCLAIGCQAQFNSFANRPHPIHSRRQMQMDNFLFTAALLGMDMSEPFMMQYMQQAGMLPPGPARGRGRAQAPPLWASLFMDGPDSPDPVAPQARGGRRGGAGGGAGAAAGGEEAAPARGRGGGGGQRRRGARRRPAANAGAAK